MMLKGVFSTPTVSALYVDFKHILALPSSLGGNSIPKIERLTTLLGHLNNTSLQLSDTLQAMILLAALPPKWDSVVQLYFQCNNLATTVIFPNRRKTIIQEYAY
jgi:hypothetical protein